jgi:hypothetical protein
MSHGSPLTDENAPDLGSLPRRAGVTALAVVVRTERLKPSLRRVFSREIACGFQPELSLGHGLAPAPDRAGRPHGCAPTEVAPPRVAGEGRTC